MKLDMDLAREILVKIEDGPEFNGLGHAKVTVEGKPAQEVSYHVLQLHEAGLVTMQDVSNTTDGLVCWVGRLTWAGHQFLAAARDDGLWRKAKKITLEKTGGLTFEGLKTVLMKLITDALTGG